MYRIIDKFGETAFHAEKDGRRFILKLCLPEERPVYDRLMSLRNENIAGIYGYTMYEGRPYVVREFVNGLSIGEYILTYGTLDGERIKHLAKGICNGLTAIHSLGIVHRDITPENIIIDEHFNAKIIDFGISRLYESGKAKDTQVLGTVGYAAPEQFGFRQTTAKADIYALGALINYMAEGELPIDRLTTGKYRPIVLRCTQMDDRKRYRSVEEVSSALDGNFLLRRIISNVPGFSGSRKKAILASIYYLHVITSGFFSFALRGQFTVLAAYLACVIGLPFIIADSAGSIKAFCDNRGLSHTAFRFIKALLCILVVLAAMTIIIFTYK